RDFLAVLETLDTPHSLFEQYYGLLLGDAMLADLDALQQRLLRDAITRARRKRSFKRDAPLNDLSEHLLHRLGERF
ncbi:MAG TPA: hypothetical protein VNT54_00775, partial [Solirubrobacteraceae bacterium]|nr:hypothetical protein [Solirubrobacteraceae bacterium]